MMRVSRTPLREEWWGGGEVGEEGEGEEREGEEEEKMIDRELASVYHAALTWRWI